MEYLSDYSVASDVLKSIFKYTTIVWAGAITAFEASLIYLIPCFLIVIVDMFSAISLKKRMAEKYDVEELRERGKFRSSPAMRVISTMIKILIAIIVSHYVDSNILQYDNFWTTRFVAAAFIFIQFWSILENSSSENDRHWAILAQTLMVNKAERHLGIDLSVLKNRINTKSNEKQTDSDNINSFDDSYSDSNISK